MPPVVFLDIDGVLLPFGEGGRAAKKEDSSSASFSSQCLHALSTILTAVPSAVICLSSTWRCGGGQEEIIRQFKSCGFSKNASPLSSLSKFEHTTSLTQHDHRQWEIANWLKSTTVDVTSWVVLDDEEVLEASDAEDSNSRYRELFRGHVVKTKSSVGLTHRQAKSAILILQSGKDGHTHATQNSAPSREPTLPISSLKLDVNTCRHWWRKGSCRMGSSCRFLHPPRASLPIVPRRKYRQQTRNSGRMGTFRRWVVSTFGKDSLAQGSGILDVAAGKGVLAFELLNVHGIATTVVDPRPMQLARNKKLWRAGFYHKKSKLSTLADDHLAHYQPPRSSEESPLVPKHIRGFFEQALWSPLLSAGDVDGCDQHKNSGNTVFENAAKVFHANLKRAESTVWTKKGLEMSQHEEASALKPITSRNVDEKLSEIVIGGSESIIVENMGSSLKVSDRCKDVGEDPSYLSSDTTVRSFEIALEMLRECSCILGMHPDQAACPIVEFAVSMGKPFAVVPCCVYSSQIRRRMANGQQVKSYDDLLNYLESLAPDIKRLKLPHLEGKNVCLFRA